MNTYVVHHADGACVVKAESPSAALRELTTDPIHTEPGMLTAGQFSVMTPASWS